MKNQKSVNKNNNFKKQFKALSVEEILPGGETRRRILNAGDTLCLYEKVIISIRDVPFHEVSIGTISITAKPDKETDFSIYWETDSETVAKIMREGANKLEGE